MRMSLRMENFCRAYVLGGVAKTAALEAGYSDSYARCRAYKLLDHLAVRVGIEQLRGEMREHNVGDADADESFSLGEPRFRNRYLEVLWAIGSSSMEEMIVDGEMVEPDPGSLAWWAIKRWKEVPDGKGGTTPMIELHDKVPALREFGKATGFNVPVAQQPIGKTDKNQSSVGGSEFDRKMSDKKIGQSRMPITEAGFGERAAVEATDKNRAFGPMFEEAGAGGVTDKNRAFAPMFSESADVGATDKDRAFAPMFEETGTGEATDEDRAFEVGIDRGIGATPPQSGLGEPLRSDAGPASATTGTEAACESAPPSAAPVVRSWTEQVAMLKREPVQVLEMLVLGLLLDPMWQGKRVPASKRGEMIAELLHAVPREVAMWLVKRLEEESEVNEIP